MFTKMRKMMNNRGFTLLEAMLASAIAVTVIVGILFLHAQVTYLRQIAKDKTVAMNDAATVLEEMRNRSYTSLGSITSEDWTTWAANNGCTSLSQEVVTVNFAGTDPITVTVTVSWTIKQRPYTLQISTIMTRR